MVGDKDVSRHSGLIRPLISGLLTTSVTIVSVRLGVDFEPGKNTDCSCLDVGIFLFLVVFFNFQIYL